jgi:hypothetical protein
MSKQLRGSYGKRASDFINRSSLYRIVLACLAALVVILPHGNIVADLAKCFDNVSTSAKGGKK